MLDFQCSLRRMDATLCSTSTLTQGIHMFFSCPHVQILVQMCFPAPHIFQQKARSVNCKYVQQQSSDAPKLRQSMIRFNVWQRQLDLKGSRPLRISIPEHNERLS